MIEIMRRKSAYIYRQNPWNPRIIDKRANVHRARWQHYSSYETPEIARAELLKLEKKEQATD